MGKRKAKPYKIIGAYDSETCNLVDGLSRSAFPVLHQLGLIDTDIELVDASNVERHTTVTMFRHTLELYEMLDFIASQEYGYVPVICCHNLSFDMYGLAAWLKGKDVRVLAKSQRKPISFSILDDAANVKLVIWDTLIFSQKPLSYMGRECGYAKLSGDWDYDLVRTPETPLTPQEEAYAAHDVYALLAWLGYWCKLNPDIDVSELALRVVSKTGVVRRRRVQRFSKLKGAGMRRNVGKYWGMVNTQNSFSTDEELFACQASTRGGFTFCARANASRVFDFGEDDHCAVYGFDATSQHPAQMVSHKYPVRFRDVSRETLQLAFQCVELVTLEDVLEKWQKPFPSAFYGYFKFDNLRLKPNTPFSDFGIAPLAFARCADYKRSAVLEDDNQDTVEFREHSADAGYKDTCVNGTYSFGKLEAAESATLWLTELAAWEVAQAYDYDAVEALGGYLTYSFDRPSDMTVISVMQFYGAKNAFKHARACYYGNEPVDNADALRAYGIPDFVVDGMNAHDIEDSIVESTYLGLKADLNALFGIEACNEYRRDTVLGASGIEYEGGFGVENAPEAPKAFYQMGQRIVGWSRIAQIVVLMLSYPYIETCINGDTDSLKVVIDDCKTGDVQRVIGRLGSAIDKAKMDVCERVRKAFPEQFDPLEGIGHYILEFTVKKFCASWNKAYCVSEVDRRDGLEHIRFTLAGVPSKGVGELADRLVSEGWSFAQVCDVFLGYNVTYSHDITGLNARSFPDWAEVYSGKVTDCRGIASFVAEPAALCLYPMAKTVNDTANVENAVNMSHAVTNNPNVNTRQVIINANGIVRTEDLIHAI